jgi:hypothetical protein
MAAQIVKKVLLIDGDLRKPAINKIFRIKREPDLTDVILANYTHYGVVLGISGQEFV